MSAPGTDAAETALYNLTGAESDEDSVRQVERGLPRKAFDRLQVALGVPQNELAGFVMIPIRTLSRRQRLLIPESDRVLRVGLLFQRALEVLGEPEAARRWMLSPKKGLSGGSPLQTARTEIGARRVEQLLGQIEHGIFS
jgi:putative toxin-antitoxin system antitoxin component (TIGR02293 family)